MAFRDYDPYERDYGIVPDIVKQFVVYLYRHIRERNIPEIESMYEVSFPKLSDRYFKQGPWPPVDAISDLVDQDHVFCLLYKELYFRHLYAKTQPSLRARCESWDNYCDLFGVILHGNVNMLLPNSWLWAMVDEFLYQFQSFAQYRTKLAGKSAEEVELLKKCDKVWNILDVLNVLQALIDKSGIVAELSRDGGAELAAHDGYIPGQSNVLRMLGYFSLVGQLRVHCLIGDYSTGLQSLFPLNLFERGKLYTQLLSGCHITLFYYSSFAYVMLQRYTDAGRCLNAILSYIHRVKQLHARNAAYDQILKKNEQMYALLALVVGLCPAVQSTLDEHVLVALKDKFGEKLQSTLDEHVLVALKDKFGEKLQRMFRGDEGLFDEAFMYGCPKFITAAPPAYDNPSAAGPQEAYLRQRSLFLRQVGGVSRLPLLKQYLLLYSSISLPKLAGLLETDEATLRTALACLKKSNYCLQWDGGRDMTSGSFTSTADIDFYIDVDTATGAELVMLSDNITTRHQAELLSRHIVKFEAIVRDLEAPPVAVAAPAQAAY
uniref:Eukaryotic translation initiation factor 3 subunit L n=1 Tax=Tetradesmus obliquus TaxID=3088 RepID=A0A383V606_TETOB